MFKKIGILLLFLPYLLGYKTFPSGNAWIITKSDSKIFLQFCRTLTIEQNDISETSDPLYNQTLTHQTVVTSIENDYNNIASSYIQLSDTLSDGSFNSSTHSQRIISICGGSTGAMAGYAQQTMNSSGQVTGCAITLGSMSGKAKSMIRTLTHEIGHCLGLDHPQETSDAIMSYFSDQNTIRLQGDDKAGLVYLYPQNSSYSRKNTLGTSCSPQ